GFGPRHSFCCCPPGQRKAMLQEFVGRLVEWAALDDEMTHPKAGLLTGDGAVISWPQSDCQHQSSPFLAVVSAGRRTCEFVDEQVALLMDERGKYVPDV